MLVQCGRKVVVVDILMSNLAVSPPCEKQDNGWWWRESDEAEEQESQQPEQRWEWEKINHSWSSFTLASVASRVKYCSCNVCVCVSVPATTRGEVSCGSLAACPLCVCCMRIR